MAWMDKLGWRKAPDRSSPSGSRDWVGGKALVFYPRQEIPKDRRNICG